MECGIPHACHQRFRGRRSPPAQFCPRDLHAARAPAIDGGGQARASWNSGSPCWWPRALAPSPCRMRSCLAHRTHPPSAARPPSGMWADHKCQCQDSTLTAFHNQCNLFAQLIMQPSHPLCFARPIDVRSEPSCLPPGTPGPMSREWTCSICCSGPPSGLPKPGPLNLASEQLFPSSDLSQQPEGNRVASCLPRGSDPDTIPSQPTTVDTSCRAFGVVLWLASSVMLMRVVLVGAVSGP